MYDCDIEPGSWQDSCEQMWEFIDSRLDKSVDESEDEAKTLSWLRRLDKNTLLDVCGYYYLHTLDQKKKDLCIKVLPYLLETLEAERVADQHFGKW